MTLYIEVSDEEELKSAQIEILKQPGEVLKLCICRIKDAEKLDILTSKARDHAYVKGYTLKITKAPYGRT